MTSPSVLAGEARRLLLIILGGRYTPEELRTFVELCYFLSLPFVRRKIALGKINLDAIGLTESDIVYDCLADAFQRDEQGRVLRFEHYCELLDPPLEHMTAADTLVALRRLLFGVVNKGVIRIYSEADPILAKILRNLRLAVDRSAFFDHVTVFGEPHLTPRNLDVLADKPFLSYPDLQLAFSRFVRSTDTIPVMVQHLYHALLSEDRFRRTVPTVQFALLIKEIYTLGWGEPETESARTDEEAELDTLGSLIREHCEAIRARMYDQYVTSGKKDERTFMAYIRAVEDILQHSVRHGDASPFAEMLGKHLPGLSDAEYLEQHRSVLEYLVKRAKAAIRKSLNSERFP